MAKDGDIIERLKMMPGYEVDELVERSLYQRAVGYNVNAEKIFYNRRTGEVVRVPYIKHVPPDVTAALSWLRNRDPQNWRENHHLNVPSDDSTAISLEEAREKLLAKVFGVVERLARQKRTIEGRAVETGQQGGV